MLVQGELPKRRLLALFGEDETSCLFATMGFWQGVDIPGRSLSLVVLDRLPFPRPGDPLTDAQRERAGDAAFRLVDLPRAATLLAQGAGRLIRSSEDRGVVAVLDPRLATADLSQRALGGAPADAPHHRPAPGDRLPHPGARAGGRGRPVGSGYPEWLRSDAHASALGEPGRDDRRHVVVATA